MFAEPTGTYVATIATKNEYVATIATQNRYVSILRDRRIFMRLCATQKSYVTTLRDPKKICCDTARPKKDKLRHCKTQKIRWGTARPKKDKLRHCATCSFLVTMVATLSQGLRFIFWPTRPKNGLFRPSRLGSICFDRLETRCLCFDYTRTVGKTN